MLEGNFTLLPSKDDFKNKDTIEDSTYSTLLNNYLNLCDRKCNYLNNKIEKINVKKAFAGALPTLMMSLILLFLALGAINPSILLMISNLIFSLSIAIKMFRNCMRKLQNYDMQLYTLKRIREYFESEIKIANEYNNILANFNVLQIEKFHADKLFFILRIDKYTDCFSKNYLSNLISQYSKELSKNLVIIESLKGLDDKEKKEYLEMIYSKTDSDFIKPNINTSKNLLADNKQRRLSIKIELNNHSVSSILSNKIKLTNKDATPQENLNYILFGKDNFSSNDETLNQPIKPELQGSIKPVSLKKDDYNLPYYEQNGIIYKYGDPMPPMFQEENGKKFRKEMK